MTDEQWFWLFINQAIDNDEQMEHLCPTCQHDATSDRCHRCGKPIGNGKNAPKMVNPNFDPDRFAALSNGTNTDVEHEDDDFDLKLAQDILRGSNEGD